MAKMTFPINRGKPIRVSFYIQEGDTLSALTAKQLLGSTARIHIRPNVKSLDAGNNPLLTFSTTDGTILTLANDGYIHVEFDDVTATTGTANPCLADAVWDLEITGTDGIPVMYPDADDERWLVEFGEVVTA